MSIIPIYDNNGSSNLQIEKIFDNNGTSDAQISEAYDNNGTTNQLVYKLLTKYIIIGANRNYTGSWPYVDGSYAHAGSLSNSGTSIQQTTIAVSYTNRAGAANARSGGIDLTKYSKLYFTISGTYYMQYGRVGLSQTAWSGTALGNADYFRDNAALWKTSRYASFTGDGTYSINVSDLSGSWFIYLGIVSQYTASELQGRATYSNMYLDTQ